MGRSLVFSFNSIIGNFDDGGIHYVEDDFKVEIRY